MGVPYLARGGLDKHNSQKVSPPGHRLSPDVGVRGQGSSVAFVRSARLQIGDRTLAVPDTQRLPKCEMVIRFLREFVRHIEISDYTCCVLLDARLFPSSERTILIQQKNTLFTIGLQGVLELVTNISGIGSEHQNKYDYKISYKIMS